MNAIIDIWILIHFFSLQLIFLILSSLTLGYSIFFGNNSLSYKINLVQENNLQHIKNDKLKLKNDILIFEIENAQNSDEHIENFARERLGLSYPDEEFIKFEENEE